MSDKKGFILYKDNYEPIQNLSQLEKGELLDAIFEYNISGKTGKLSTSAKMAFGFLRPQFDRDIEKYQGICDRNTINANKRWHANNATASERIPKVPVDAHSHTDTDTDTDSHTDTKNIYIVDFLKLWNQYPRREGRKAAEKHYIAAIKAGHTYQEFELALQNYLKLIKENHTDKKFIKNGSTFFNNWEDYKTIIPAKHPEEIEHEKKRQEYIDKQKGGQSWMN